jgi:hypothetical protein
MARKPNYDFEKRKKEMDRKAKKDAKREDRLQRNREEAERDAANQPSTDDSQGSDAGPGTYTPG